MKYSIFITICLLFLMSCGDISTSQSTDMPNTSQEQDQETGKENTQTSIQNTFKTESQNSSEKLSQSDVSVTPFTTGLDVPWELVFIDDATALVTQRGGTINKVIDGEQMVDPYWEAPSIERGEGGLMGLALHPNYEQNGYIYTMYTTRDDSNMSINKVVRLVEQGDTLTIDQIILDDIPAELYHNGGRIQFGPDQKLHITTGDARDPSISQDLDSLGGKILRLNDDGTIPSDNPFENSPVYSYGHRNPQGLAWNEQGDLFMSTHGPSGEFGLTAKDRIDYITPGTNYGWPEAYGPDQGYPNPIAYWPDEATPPGDMVFWNGSLFVATLKSAALLQLDIEQTDDGYDLLSESRWFEGEYGRLRDVSVGPDGNLYILTSNGDGRSGGVGGEDMILKIEKN